MWKNTSLCDKIKLREMFMATAFKREKEEGFMIQIFTIKGNEDGDTSIPKKGKYAEEGYVGCPWYDIAEWKKQVQKKLGE